MFRNRILAAGLALAVGLVAATAAQGDTTLRYKFKEGDKLTYKTESKAAMKMSVGGQDIAMDITQSYDQVVTVNSVDKDGNAKFTSKFDNFKFVMDAPAPIGKIEYDAKAGKKPEGPIGDAMAPFFEAMSGSEFTGTMTALGDVKDVKIPEKLLKAIKNGGGGMFGDMFSEDTIKSMVSQSLISFPKDAVAKGKTWNNKQEMKAGGGTMKIDNEYTYNGPAKKDGKDLELIGIKPKVSFEADPNSPLKMKVNKQEAKGSVYFDNEAGRVVEFTTEQTLEMEVDALGQTIAQNMKQTITSKLAK